MTMHTALGYLILAICGLFLLLLGFAAGLSGMAKKPTIRYGVPPVMPKMYEGDMLSHLKHRPKVYHFDLN
jgi:hypothetical protein